MDLRQLTRLLSGEVVWGDRLVDLVQVETCFAADLMSDVLAFSRPGALLVTGLISVQAPQTADVADLAAILFVAGKRPAQPVMDLAAAKEIPLLATPHSMFEACGILHAAGLKTAART